jgi:hypothetical protein
MKADRDRDNDFQAIEESSDNNVVLNSANPAGARDRQAITTLIGRYYAAAVAEDGGKACSMLALAEAVVEDYGESLGPSYLRGGKTCREVMIKLFKYFHRRIAVDVSVLKVARVRLQEHQGLVVLRFGDMPERQIAVRREAGTWKVDALLDSPLP